MEGHEKWDGDWTQCENFVGYIHSSHTVSYSETEEHGFWWLNIKCQMFGFCQCFLLLNFSCANVCRWLLCRHTHEALKYIKVFKPLI